MNLSISPEELLKRLEVDTPLFAADEKGIFAALNDKDSGIFFAVDRRTENFRWRVENVSGWAVAPPLIWQDLYIIGTSVANMNRGEVKDNFAEISWSRGGVCYAFDAMSGKMQFWDDRTGIIRKTPRVIFETLIVEGEIRVGGFRQGEQWSASGEIESKFDLPRGKLQGRRVRGSIPEGYFRGESPSLPWT